MSDLPTYAGTHRWDDNPAAPLIPSLSTLKTRAMIAHRRDQLEQSRPWFGPEGRHDIDTMTPLPVHTFIRTRLLIRREQLRVDRAKSARAAAYDALVASTRSFGVFSRLDRP